MKPDLAHEGHVSNPSASTPPPIPPNAPPTRTFLPTPLDSVTGRPLSFLGSAVEGTRRSISEAFQKPYSLITDILKLPPRPSIGSTASAALVRALYCSYTLLSETIQKPYKTLTEALLYEQRRNALLEQRVLELEWLLAHTPAQGTSPRSPRSPHSPQTPLRSSPNHSLHFPPASHSSTPKSKHVSRLSRNAGVTRNESSGHNGLSSCLSSTAVMNAVTRRTRRPNALSVPTSTLVFPSTSSTSSENNPNHIEPCHSTDLPAHSSFPFSDAGSGDSHPQSVIAPPTASTAPTHFQVSQNVLVIDDQGPHLESLRDYVRSVYGGDFESPYEQPLQDDALLSLTTAQYFLDHRRATSESAGQRRLSLSTVERLFHPATSAAQKIINLLKTEAGANFSGLSAMGGHYAEMLIKLCAQATTILAQDPPFLSVQSPIYVMGDMHGSAEDLNFFLRRLVNFDHLCYTSSRLLFLGDYVDRGPAGCEVAAMLLAMKCIAPESVFLLRGNHETAEVNRDIARYQANSFLAQCHHRFGQETGDKVWQAFNEVFAQLPMAAEIDGCIFCAHGGIPRPVHGRSSAQLLEMLRKEPFPRRESWVDAPQDTPEEQMWMCLVFSLLWSDPATAEDELDEEGFGVNDSRGAMSHVFGAAALERFLNDTGYQFLLRAHEVKQQGLRICHDGRVITVFSSSGYCGGDNGAGAVFINRGKIRLICCSFQPERTPPTATASPAQDLDPAPSTCPVTVFPTSAAAPLPHIVELALQAGRGDDISVSMASDNSTLSLDLSRLHP